MEYKVKYSPSMPVKLNKIEINSCYSFIGTGNIHCIESNFGFIGGGSNNTICTGSDYSGIMGGFQQIMQYEYGFIGGGYNNRNCGAYGFVGGGKQNRLLTGLSSSSAYSFIGGGMCNQISGVANVITGGFGNSISGSCDGNYPSGNFVGGGCCNSVESWSCNNVVVGGQQNFTCLNSWTAIVGGCCNWICRNSDGSFIGGGQCNMFCSSGGSCTEGNGFIGSGCANCIYDGNFAAILGGGSNCVSGCYSAVLGGQGNTVSHNYAAAFGCGISSVCGCAFHANNFVAQNMPTFSGGPSGSFWVCNCGTCHFVMINL